MVVQDASLPDYKLCLLVLPSWARLDDDQEDGDLDDGPVLANIQEI